MIGRRFIPCFGLVVVDIHWDNDGHPELIQVFWGNWHETKSLSFEGFWNRLYPALWAPDLLISFHQHTSMVFTLVHVLSLFLCQTVHALLSGLGFARHAFPFDRSFMLTVRALEGHRSSFCQKCVQHLDNTNTLQKFITKAFLKGIYGAWPLT